MMHAHASYGQLKSVTPMQSAGVHNKLKGKPDFTFYPLLIRVPFPLHGEHTAR